MPKRPRATRPHMPGYGVPGDEGALRSFSWGEEILREAHTYWLATGRADGRPHVMPVWAVWHADALWFSTGGASRKARNLAARAECSIGAERGTGAVILEGLAERMVASAAPVAVSELYRAKYGDAYPDDSQLFRVEPRAVFGFDESAEFSETATRWLFE